MVSCQNCGNQLPVENAQFCDMCGKPVISSIEVPTSPIDKPVKNEDNRKSNLKYIVIIISIITLGIILALSYASWLGSQIGNSGTPTTDNASVIDSVYSGQDEIIAGGLIYYTIPVPSDVTSAKLLGTFQVMDGETIQVDVLEEEGCPAPENSFECVAIYSVSKNSGSVELDLEPGKTYYLEFSNKAFLFPTKTVNVDFQLEVTY